MTDGKSEYHLTYTSGAYPRDEVFASELAALGRASTVMRQRINHDVCIRNAAGQTVHSEGSLANTSRLFRGR